MFAIALFSCGGEAASVAPQPEVVPEPASASTQTAAERYAECKSRVELPEADGECASDPDCAGIVSSLGARLLDGWDPEAITARTSEVGS